MRRCCLSAVLAAVVLAQLLGFMHRVVHAGTTAGVEAAAVAAQPDEQPSGTSAEAWLGDLFPHEDESSCRIFDGAGLQALVSFDLPVLLPIVATMPELRLRAGEFVARWVALFDARGPPFSR
jgi:hypothetical protein